MFISFLLPYIDRGQGPIFHWIMAAQAGKFRTGDLILIADDKYFSAPQPWGRDICLFDVPFRYREISEWQSIRKYTLPLEIFRELDQSCLSILEAFRRLLTEDYPPLRNALRVILAEICREERPEAVLSWCSMPSLHLAAAEFRLPVIHNELGPFRPPNYQGTVYFDFNGVNGGTSAARDCDVFLEQVGGESTFSPLSMDELRQILMCDPKRAHNGTKALYKRGAALQVEDDSNLIAFSRGMTNFDLIFAARKGITPGELLIRRHPRGYLDYSSQLGILDDSTDSIDFITHCEEIFCTNSSVAFEAMLMGKPVRVLGDSPIAELSRQCRAGLADRERLICLNYMFLGYLVPLPLLFNIDYYRWRLKGPSPLEIYQRHLELFRCFRDHCDANELSRKVVGLS
jgi:hypothetical protein